METEEPIHRIRVADNFHYMDEGEAYDHDVFPSLEDAISYVSALSTSFFESPELHPATAAELWQKYSMFCEDS
jgi:hypothetical protein